jgi:tripartite-type tricarboxylate transporter receptor subunit TctC
VIAKLYRDIVAAMRTPSVRDKLLPLQTDVVSSASPEEFSAFVRNETSRWGDVIRMAGVQAE